MSGRVLLEPHAHTKEVSSCGMRSAAELMHDLKSAGYGAVVITDHYLPGERGTPEERDAFLTGYRAAKALEETLGILVLPGMEIRFKDRPEDFLVYGMEEADFIDLPADICEQGLSEFYAWAHPRGWMVYQAHPYRRGHLPAHTAFIDGMETCNANPRHNSQNRMAAKFASLHDLHTIAGSDAHRKGDVGLAGIHVPQDALTPKGLAKWLAATPHPRFHHQDAPVDGIRYTVGAIPGHDMMRDLYADAGWTSYTDDMNESMDALRASARVVCAWDDTALVGMTRLITDGITIAYVQDILVLGVYKRRGIGRELLRRVLQPYRNVRQTVLITDDLPQTRAFYMACGFSDVREYSCVGFIRLR